VYFPKHRPLDALDGKRLRDVTDQFKALRRHCNKIRKRAWSSAEATSIEESRDTFEHQLCEMLADYRCFLEDPLFLAYYRASVEFHHDRFFEKMGQTLKRRTAPHARNKSDEADSIAAQRETGIAPSKVIRLDVSLVNPEADIKLLKRHNVKVQKTTRQTG
jgi:hypothetical protein